MSTKHKLKYFETEKGIGKKDEVATSLSLHAVMNELIDGACKQKLKEIESDEESIEGELITEQIVALESYKKKQTMKEKVIPYKKIKGFPECTDDTRGFPECLPPGQIVTTRIRSDVQCGIPMNKPVTKEQFIELMHCFQDYPTNDYIYFTYVHPPNSPEFTPYTYKIIAFKDVDPLHDYFTMSKGGIMHFKNGCAEYTDAHKFIKYMFIYERMRDTEFFKLFPMRKTIAIWKSTDRQTEFRTNRKELEDLLFITKRPLRRMLILLFTMIEKISDMGFLYLQPGVTYKNVEEFSFHQQNRIQDLMKRFNNFEKLVQELTETACRTYLIESGFTTDNYDGEVEFYLKALEVPLHKVTSDSINIMDYPGQWLPFSLQSKKRRICERLTRFIHLIDYYVQATYQRILKNSCLVLMVELYNRTKFLAKNSEQTPAYFLKFTELKDRNELLHGKIISGDPSKAIVQVSCLYEQDSLIFSPSKEEFQRNIKILFEAWKDAIFQYRNILPLEVMHPYTRPVVNGHMEKKICGPGPDKEMLYKTDPDLFDIQNTIEMIIAHSFDHSNEFIDFFNHIRVFCLENDSIDVAALKLIDDITQIKTHMEKYYGQLNTVKDTVRTIHNGIFNLDTKLLQIRAIHSIVRIIEAFQESLPMHGHNCMRALTEKLESIILELDKTPESIEESAEYFIHLLQNIEKMETIEEELDNCNDFVDLIDTYFIIIDDDEAEGYTNLLPLVNKLRNQIEIHLSNRASMLEGITKHLEEFKQNLAASMAETQKRLEEYATYEPRKAHKVVEELAKDHEVIYGLKELVEKYMGYKNIVDVEFANYQNLIELLEKIIQEQERWEEIAKLVGIEFAGEDEDEED